MRRLLIITAAVMALGAAPASAHTSPQHLSVGHGRRAIVEDANSWLPGLQLIGHELPTPHLGHGQLHPA